MATARRFDPYAMSVTTAEIDALDAVDGLGATRSQLGTAMRTGKGKLDFTQMPTIPAEVMHVTKETLDTAPPVAAFYAPPGGEDEEAVDEGAGAGAGTHEGGLTDAVLAAAAAVPGGDPAPGANPAREDYDAALSDVSSLDDEAPTEQQRELEELMRAELWASIKKKLITIKTVEVPKSVTVNSKVATLRYWLRRLNGEEGALGAAQDHVDTMKMVTGAVGQVSKFFRQQVGDMSGLTDAILGNEEELLDPLTKLFRARMGSAPPQTPEEKIRSIYMKRFGRYLLDHQLPQILSLVGGPATEEHPFSQQSPAELAFAQKQHITEADLDDIGPNSGRKKADHSWSAPPPMPSAAGSGAGPGTGGPPPPRPTAEVEAEQKKLDALRQQQALATKNLTDMANMTKQLQLNITKATDRVKQLKTEMEFTQSQLENLRQKRAAEERAAAGAGVKLPHAASVAGGDASVMFSGKPTVPASPSVAKPILSSTSRALPPRPLPPATPMPQPARRSFSKPLPALPSMPTSPTSPTPLPAFPSAPPTPPAPPAPTAAKTARASVATDLGLEATTESPHPPTPPPSRPRRSSAQAAMAYMQAEMQSSDWAAQVAGDDDEADGDFQPTDSHCSGEDGDDDAKASQATTAICM